MICNRIRISSIIRSERGSRMFSAAGHREVVPVPHPPTLEFLRLSAVPKPVLAGLPSRPFLHASRDIVATFGCGNFFWLDRLSGHSHFTRNELSRRTCLALKFGFVVPRLWRGRERSPTPIPPNAGRWTGDLVLSGGLGTERKCRCGDAVHAASLPPLNSTERRPRGREYNPPLQHEGKAGKTVMPPRDCDFFIISK